MIQVSANQFADRLLHFKVLPADRALQGFVCNRYKIFKTRILLQGISKPSFYNSKIGTEWRKSKEIKVVDFISLKISGKKY